MVGQAAPDSLHDRIGQSIPYGTGKAVFPMHGLDGAEVELDPVEADAAFEGAE